MHANYLIVGLKEHVGILEQIARQHASIQLLMVAGVHLGRGQLSRGQLGRGQLGRGQ